MSESTPIEAFFNQVASGAMVEEANRFSTLPKDNYTAQVVKAEGKVWSPDDPEKRREVAHLTVSILKNGKKVKTLFPNVSWIERRTSTGRLDRTSLLWGQLQKALFPTATGADLAAKTVGEVVEAALRYPVSAYVTSGFAVPSEKNPKFTNTQTPRSAEEEKEYRLKGYKEVNEILSFSKHQEGR